MNSPLSIVLFSGTKDKLTAASVIAAGAAASGKETTLFLTYWGLRAFRRDADPDAEPFSPEATQLPESERLALASAGGLPSWRELLRDAVEVGQLRIKACNLTLECMGLRLEDLDPMVSGITTVGEFIQESEGGQLLFI